MATLSGGDDFQQGFFSEPQRVQDTAFENHTGCSGKKENGYYTTQGSLIHKTLNSHIMKIIDLDGKEIEVTDLALALLQADDYRHYRVTNPTGFHHHLQNYWEDFYQKLILLDKEIKG